MSVPDRPPRGRAPARTLVAAALLLGAAVAAQLAAAAPALAHDELVSTDPAAGSTVPAAPDEVVLTFAEPPLTLGLGVDVTGPGGTVSTGAPTLDGSTVHQQLAPGAPAGSYTVRWRVTADDGHPVSGSFAFVVSSGATSATSAGSAPTGVAASSSPNADPRDTASPLLWWSIVGAAAVLIVAGATLALTRRRGRPPAAGEGGQA
jgi:methionine-rich copper-binding protein CopC